MSKEKDYYKILQVSINATDTEIKKAYKKLALKYHPDKITDKEKVSELTELFRDASEAYQVLSDVETKAAYDNKRKHGHNSSFNNNFTFNRRDPFELFKTNFGNAFDDEFFKSNVDSFSSMNTKISKMKHDMNNLKQNTSGASFHSVSSSSSCINGKMKQKVTKIGVIDGKTIKEVTETENGITTITKEIDGVTSITKCNPDGTKQILDNNNKVNKINNNGNNDNGIIDKFKQ